MGDLHAVLVGSQPDQIFGDGTSVPGDVDGDGCEDLVVTASDGLRVFFGPLGPGVWSADEADLFYPGSLGDQIYRAGDVNHDERDDFWADTRLLSYDGTNLVLLASFDGGAYVTGGFDADQDGELDALVGSGDGSQILLAYGPLQTWGSSTLNVGSLLSAPADAAILSGVCQGANSSAGAQWLGDLDGDGTGEILMAHCHSHGGIFHGGDLRGQTLVREDAWIVESLGLYPELAMDVNGDGVNDIQDLGGVWSGSSFASGSPSRLITSGDRGVRSLGGDADGDGRADLLLSQNIDRTEWVVGGPWASLDSSTLPDPGTPVGTDGGAQHVPFLPGLELAAENAGDITGDGRVDILGRNVEAGGGGAVYIWASEVLTVLHAPGRP